MNLFELLENRKFPAFKQRISDGENPNVMNEDTGESLIAQAVRSGQIKLVQFLLEAGADPNFKKSINLPLTEAVIKKSKSLVAILLAAGAKTETKGEDGSTALIIAATVGHVGIVNQLIEAGANPKANDECGRTAIVYAAEKNHRKIVELLAPLSTKASREQAKLILDLGQQTDISEDERYYINAAHVGILVAVRRYLDADIPVDTLGRNGETALMMAANGGRLSVVQYLVEHGANVNHKNASGEYPLTYAALGGHSAVFEFLYPLTSKSLRKRAEKIKEAMIARDQWKLPEDWE
jgi:ankyrin repeat protein